MGVLKDYIKWRADLEFWQDEFNVIDNLVLSCLSYLELDDIFTVDEPEVQSIVDISDKYFSNGFDEKKFREGSILKDAPLLLREVATRNRYKNIKIRNYVSLNDTSRTLQFAAMEFLLPDGSSYIAYRGTDDTVVGWKEDFMLALKETEAEKESVSYINRIASGNTRTLRVGGHSKGGHLAVFASAMCNRDIKRRIIKVYSNDGPGFLEKTVSSKPIKEILPRIVSIIPVDSIVGLLMTPVIKPIVVKSTAFSVGQHNLTTWCIEGKELVTVDDVSKGAKKIDKLVKENIGKMSDEELDEFVQNLFSVFESAGAATLTEFKKGGLKSIQAIAGTVSKKNK